MSYSRVNWKNGSSQPNTPINADNLNRMDEGIATLDTSLTTTSQSLDQRITSLENRPKVEDLFYKYPLTSGDNDYTLISGGVTHNVNDYDLLIICGTFYDNVVTQAVVPVSYFNTTVLDAKAIYFSNNYASYGFAKGATSTQIKIRYNAQSAYAGVHIWGIKL